MLPRGKHATLYKLPIFDVFRGGCHVKCVVRGVGLPTTAYPSVGSQVRALIDVATLAAMPSVVRGLDCLLYTSDAADE